MKQSSILHISALIGSSYAQTQAQGFGIRPVDVLSTSLLSSANQNPNATRTVPFSIGDKNFTLTVNVTELTPTGINETQVANPRIINSVSGLGWTGDETLNDTIATPRFCVQFPSGELLSRSVTNNYKESDNGDCTHALGQKCAEAIKNTGFSLGVPCSSIVMPEASLLTSNTSANNSNGFGVSNGFGFSFWSSDIYSAGNTTWFERETERLQVFIFSAEKAYPVCVRVKTDRVGGDSPASGASRTSAWGRSAAWVAFAVAWLL